jgi:outer membrane protein assembly factor BamB
MKTQIGFALLGLMLYGAAAVAEEKAYAPLREKVLAAKTVMLVNESGTARFGDELYRQIKSWNRWEVVADRGKADLVLVLSPSDTVPVMVSSASEIASGQTVYGTEVTAKGNMQTQHWHLYVMDAKTGENLWTAEASMGGKLWRSWGSIAKSLLTDIQKRMQ